MNNWLLKDHLIHLPKLFEYLGFRLVRSDNSHHIFKNGGEHYVIINTEKEYFYYKVQRPQEKLSASDLITEYVSKVEALGKELIWDKVDNYYNKVLQTTALLIKNNPEDTLITVQPDFNHFLSYQLPLEEVSENLYYGVENSNPFSGRVFLSDEGSPLFPMFNLQNEVCGYFQDLGKEVVPYRESAIKHSLWYSNIPKRIEGLFLFNNPKEALAFHRKFQLKNVVYMALGEINLQTTDILFQIQRLTKVDKLFLSFTGNKKIEGYLRDLHFISYINDSDFNLTLTDRDILLRFPMENEKSFSRFYDHTRRFNKELTQSFLNFNKIIDQNRLNKYSILVSKDKEDIKVRLPIESNAIKLLVWSYYKNYLNKTIDILKPKSNNWHTEWENTQNQVNEGKEVQLKEYRIAL
ncbi:hypothetical protein KCTC52924_03511 [Arenibacter antarcticus]|uniref:Type II toxin-antitoxin system HicA family toxin n=1 Tax=Arenibacter antarcticus TaxID=2040469 RepID=A0ABW5VEA0_9FLAO|nr:type II toxin-antitoxin system HicA family toxin [Arenibacter sp. H213]MCM4166571.1 hypothetical protein [Arenibacter sp. H213]